MASGWAISGEIVSVVWCGLVSSPPVWLFSIDDQSVLLIISLVF